jgi:hypothetical protein
MRLGCEHQVCLEANGFVAIVFTEAVRLFLHDLPAWVV